MRLPAWGGSVVMLALLLPLALPATSAHAQPGPAFVPAEDVLAPGEAAARLQWPLDVLASDADGDGDTDLLIHWHLFQPLELYENHGGRFVLRNRPGADESGLDENRGVADLFVDSEAMMRAIRAAGGAGLYVWHDPDRHGSWRFLWIDADGSYGRLGLDLQTNLTIRPGPEVPKEDVEQLGEGRLRIQLSGAERRFSVVTKPVGAQLLLRFDVTSAGVRPPVFAGAARTLLQGERLELWKPDPHGIAWVDVEGTPHRELFVTRGGLGGRLTPPMDPKEDRYYVHTGDLPSPYRRAPAGFVPPGYGRGRRVEWVDADGDGRLDLSVSNESSPNVLLVRDASGALRDRATELGVDFEGAVTQAWADFDGDGRDDLFFLGEGSIDLARAGADGRFQVTSGTALGLAVPVVEPAPGPIEGSALHWSDFDADGDLDLWLSNHGREGALHLFRRDGNRFRDVTEAAGLANARGSFGVVLLDFDNDGFEDVLTLGKRARLWRNVGGRRFHPSRLESNRVRGWVHAGAALDADSDGRTDFVLLSRRRHLFLNRHEGNSFLDVSLKSERGDPIGALVRAHYDDGRVRVQRLGSAHNSGFSQSVQPLHFGIPAGARLLRVGVTWPGEREEQVVPVDGAGRILVVKRP